MKVLQVNATYGLGSTGTIVRDLKECCEEHGIECYVAYALTDEKVERGYKIGNWFFNKLHALLSRIAGKQAYFSYIPTLWFIHYIKKLQPDVVHLHNLHSNYINLPIFLKYLAKNNVRTIITLHDCWWYTGGCYYYTAAVCSKWLDKCGKCPKRFFETPAYFIDKSAEILNDKKKYLLAIPRLYFVGVSDWISNEARKSFLASKTIMTIHNGIDLSVFKPTPSDLREKLGLTGKYVILGPASKWLDPINSVALNYFIKVMRDDEVLLLFGTLSSYVNGLSEKVKLYGYTKNRQELAALYSMADIFVNVSREDTLSLINVEAQACGTPIITFDATGPKETVDEENSLSVPVGNYERLYDCVQCIRLRAGDGTSSNCREFISQKFSKTDKFKEYINLYTESYLNL